MLPWREWIALGWPVLGFSLAVLLLRRPLVLIATGLGLGAGLLRRDALFLAWFAPVGVAAMYYAILAEERTGDPLFWHATNLVIAISVLAHGVTSSMGLTSYRRARG